MNKKQYIAPKMVVCLLETQNFIAGSQFNDTGDNQTITPTEEEYSGEFTSRRKNTWDEFEDEEEEY